ncbi:MAG: hypothetical protein NXI20_25035 [bacterium]|nr:hypothetical protein [bacterium]
MNKIEIKNWIVTSKYFQSFYLLTLLSVGILYIVWQNIKTQNIKDSLFIGLLFGGTLVLILGINWIYLYFKSKLNSLYESLASKKMDYESFFDLSNRIFTNHSNIIAGIIYGFLIGLSPFYLNTWEEHLQLRIILSVFLFIVNFLTGCAFISLINLFIFSYKIGNFIKVELYDRSDLSAQFVLNISKWSSLIAAIYISFCICSIYFSVLPIGGYTIGYSIFSGIIIVVAYIFPMVPIRNAIADKKKEAIQNFSKKLQHEYDQIMLCESNEIDNAHLSKVEYYIKVLEQTSKIQTLPIGFKTIWNITYIILITLVPVVIQEILKHILK